MKLTTEHVHTLLIAAAVATLVATLPSGRDAQNAATEAPAPTQVDVASPTPSDAAPAGERPRVLDSRTKLASS